MRSLSAYLLDCHFAFDRYTHILHQLFSCREATPTEVLILQPLGKLND
jgi:hypothetical protein